MINFRFHLVSLVAVFLALATGVVMGSTVIDRAIVDGLRSRIDRVERNADARRQENAELRRQLAALTAFAEQAAPHLVRDRLTQVPVVVVAVNGVDRDVVRATAETLLSGGALLSGVLWMEPGFALQTMELQAELSRAVGEPFRRGDPLRQAALEALGRRLAAGPDPTVPGPEDLLAALARAGFVRFQSLGGDVDLARYPEAGSRVLVIDGPEAKVEPSAGALPLVRAMAGAGAPVAIGEVFHPGGTATSRGTVVGAVRDDRELAARVATVDDLDEPQGRAAVVLAVEELGGGQVGHYGHGNGATRRLPEPVTAPAATGS